MAVAKSIQTRVVRMILTNTTGIPTLHMYLHTHNSSIVVFYVMNDLATNSGLAPCDQLCLLPADKSLDSPRE